MSYRPSETFNVSAFLLVPTTTTVKGTKVKSYTPEAEPFYCSFRSFGGTEIQVNGITVVENTAVLETWYDPRFKADCRVRVGDLDYEILGTPENIEMKNQFLKFKVRVVKGGA